MLVNQALEEDCVDTEAVDPETSQFLDTGFYLL